MLFHDVLWSLESHKSFNLRVTIEDNNGVGYLHQHILIKPIVSELGFSIPLCQVFLNLLAEFARSVTRKEVSLDLLEDFIDQI